VQGQWTVTPANVLEYYVYDGHGSVRGVVDEAGAQRLSGGTIYRLDFDGFGNAIGFDPSAASAPRLQYAGEGWDCQ
jgi:hypothetical protein